MDADETKAGGTEKVLHEAAGILEPVGLQEEEEEAELPSRIMEEFVRNSRKKDKLLCSQLQVVNFLQNFLAQEDTTQGRDTLDSEDVSRQKAMEAKEQWKKLKAKYQDHIEIVKCAVILALPQIEEAQRKYSDLQEAYKQVQAKKEVIAEKLQTAQKQWQLHQRLQTLEEFIKERKKKRQAEDQQKLDQFNRELETLKQQAEQEQDKLERTQAHLQLLSILQDKPLDPEAKAEAKAEANDNTGNALPPNPL
ncbi:ZW10 interactor [Sigmodon hispidus]